MDAVRVALVVGGLLLIPALLTGLFVRGFQRACRAFVLYLVTIWISEALMLFWPDSFYNWRFWAFKELVVGALKLAMLVEVVILTFDAFPGARRTARAAVLLALLVLLGAVVLAGLRETTSFITFVQAAIALLANGTALVYAAVWALALWYHLPLYRIHWAVLRGLMLYLIVFSLGGRLLVTFGFASRPAAALLDSMAYSVLLCYWNWEVWRLEPDETPESIRRLQPWRGSL